MIAIMNATEAATVAMPMAHAAIGSSDNSAHLRKAARPRNTSAAKALAAMNTALMARNARSRRMNGELYALAEKNG